MKTISSHAQKTRHWYLSGVLFKIFGKHLLPCFIRVLLPLETGFVRVLENLESPGILFWHFPGLESPGKRPLVLESPGNLLNQPKNMKCMEGSKEN